MKCLKVGVDSYSLDPLNLSPVGLLAWVKEHGGDGVQFSGLSLWEGERIETQMLRDLAASARENGLYLEWGGGQHIPYDQWNGWRPHDTAAVNHLAAEQAAILGVSVVRSCSGGLIRWHADAPETLFLLKETARTLKEQRTMLEDFGVTLAIETHFEFTTFELERLFEMCDASPGGFLGVCLDTMNLLTMLEDPVRGTKRILPWVVATHLKDGGLVLDAQGMVSFPSAIGCGAIDLKAILELLSTLDRSVHLSIEDHGGSFSIPVFNRAFLAGFPDLTIAEFSMLLETAAITRRQMDAGKLRITDRSEWPGLCAARSARDIAALKKLAGKGGKG